MAEIFLARREGPEGFSRDLVVKRILPHLSEDPRFKEMFVEEARIVARLHHPNLVQVHDFGEVDGSFYLAMELIRGVDLRALIRRASEDAGARGHKHAMPPHHAAKILSFVCEGLASAHSLHEKNGDELGLVHRDVTPANVLVSFDGAVKVTDFGIAKLSRESRRDETVVGAVKGKYAYLSPEQARGMPLDARSDLFNVGSLLFEMVSGETLFPHDEPRDAKIMSAAGIIPEPGRIDRLPEDLARIVKRALSPDPRDRFSDALALRTELEAYLRTCPDASDTVELGAYVRDLFADVWAADRTRPRAAGTVPMTQAEGAPRPATPLSGPSTLVEEDAPRGAREASIQRRIPTMATTEGLAETRVRKKKPKGRSRRFALFALLAFLLAGSAGVGMIWFGSDGPPTEPPRAAPPPILVAQPAELRVESDPVGLTVAIDGEESGVAPLRRFLAPGMHRVELLRRDRVVASEAIELRENEPAVVRLVATPEAEGTLRIASAPADASVWIDDDLVGRTPLELKVTPGEYAVRIAAAGHVEQTDQLRVLEPGAVASLSVQLAPIAPPPPVPPPATEEPPSTTMMRRRPRREGTSGSGTLTISSTPWSEVYLGGRHLGTTPLTNIRLSAGTHTLTLRAPDHAPRRARVVIRNGETTRRLVVL